MKKVLNILLIIFICFSMYLLVFSKYTNAIEANTYGNWYYNYESKLDENYYDDLAGITDKDEFINALHLIISTNHKKYSYNDCYSLLDIIDKDLRAKENEDYIYCILTGKMMPGASGHGSAGSNTWNREHIWAKKYGFMEKDKSYPYNDLNHLRAADYTANSSMHNDKQYNEVKNPTKVDQYGNKVDEHYYEPRDAAKGDIARMIMYMDIRYNGDELSEGYNLSIVEQYYGTSLQENWDKENENGYMSVLSVLLKWHVEDPVDDFERKRNDLVYQYQQNRNPFIDHPEYANIIYGTNYQEGYTVSYYPLEGSFDYYDNKLYQANSLVIKPNIPVVPEVGYEFVGWYTDLEYKNAFDFTKDKINSNISLYAKYNFVGYTKEEAFNRVKIENAMNFKYKEVEKEDVKLLSSEILFTGPNNEYTQIPVADSPATLNNTKLKNNVTINDNLFNMTYTYAKTQGYVGYNNEVASGIIKLYAYNGNGSQLQIDVKQNTNIELVSYNIDLFFTTTTKYATKTDAVLNVNYKVTFTDSSFKIQNITNESSGNVVWIKKITLNYKAKGPTTGYEFKDTKLLYRLDLRDFVEDFKDLEVGFVVNDHYQKADIINGYIYLSIDVLDLDLVYSVKAYYKENEIYHYNNYDYLNSYSFKTLALLYYNKYFDSISDYVGVVADLM